MFLVSSCSCFCPIHWSQVFSREWRCSWSSADRRCSNYIWVINNFIAYKCAYYIRDLTVYANEGKSIISCRPSSKHLHRSVPLYRRLQSTLWYRGGVYQGQNNSLVSTLQWCPNCQEKKLYQLYFILFRWIFTIHKVMYTRKSRTWMLMMPRSLTTWRCNKVPGHQLAWSWPTFRGIPVSAWEVLMRPQLCLVGTVTPHTNDRGHTYNIHYIGS